MFSFRQKNILMAASSLFGKKEVHSLYSSLQDKRVFIETLAERKNLLEADVRRSLAKYCNVFVLDTAPSFDISKLPQGLSVESFWKYGVAPIFRGEKIIGIVCVDPGNIILVKKEWHNLPQYLCSWYAIRNALENSERNYIEEVAPTEEVLKDIFKLIIKESSGFGSDSVRVVFSEDYCQYRFKTSSNREASGTINSRIKDSFYAHLQTQLKSSQMIDQREISVTKISSDEFLIQSNTSTLKNVIPFPTSQSVKPYVRGKSVLLIDDDPIFIKVIERFFSRSNIPLYTFSSAKEAILFLKKSSSPGVILSDVHMPEMSGLQLIAELQSHDHTKEIPVFSLTADDTPETHIELLEAGAHMVLSKRTDSRVLLAYVKNILNLTDPTKNIAYS